VGIDFGNIGHRDVGLGLGHVRPSDLGQLGARLRRSWYPKPRRAWRPPAPLVQRGRQPSRRQRWPGRLGRFLRGGRRSLSRDSTPACDGGAPLGLSRHSASASEVDKTRSVPSMIALVSPPFTARERPTMAAGRDARGSTDAWVRRSVPPRGVGRRARRRPARRCSAGLTPCRRADSLRLTTCGIMRYQTGAKRNGGHCRPSSPRF
jgi:hypothetical protein